MGRTHVSVRYLQISGTDINAYSMTAGTTYTSDRVTHQFARGPAALYIGVTGGTVNVTYELSDDGETWYEPYGTGGSRINAVVSNLDESRWISFEVPIGKWIRFKFAQKDASSNVTAIWKSQE